MADITSDIRGFNTPPHIETKDSNARIVGAAVIILALASAGAYSYESGMWHSAPKQAVTASELPSPTPPAPQAAAQPAPAPAAVNNSAAVNNTAPAQPAPSPAAVATPAAAPLINNTTPVKVDRTRIVTHTIITRAPVKARAAQRPAHDRNDAASQTTQPDTTQNNVAPQNSAVTPQNTNATPNTATPQDTTPQNSNLTTAPSTTTTPATPSAPATPSQAAPVQSTPQP